MSSCYIVCSVIDAKLSLTLFHTLSSSIFLFLFFSKQKNIKKQDRLSCLHNRGQPSLDQSSTTLNTFFLSFLILVFSLPLPLVSHRPPLRVKKRGKNILVEILCILNDFCFNDRKEKK